MSCPGQEFSCLLNGTLAAFIPIAGANSVCRLKPEPSERTERSEESVRATSSSPVPYIFSGDLHSQRRCQLRVSWLQMKLSFNNNTEAGYASEPHLV